MGGAKKLANMRIYKSWGIVYSYIKNGNKWNKLKGIGDANDLSWREIM